MFVNDSLPELEIELNEYIGEKKIINVSTTFSDEKGMSQHC